MERLVEIVCYGCILRRFLFESLLHFSIFKLIVSFLFIPDDAKKSSPISFQVTCVHVCAKKNNMARKQAIAIYQKPTLFTLSIFIIMYVKEAQTKLKKLVKIIMFAMNSNLVMLDTFPYGQPRTIPCTPNQSLIFARGVDSLHWEPK